MGAEEGGEWEGGGERGMEGGGERGMEGGKAGKISP